MREPEWVGAAFDAAMLSGSPPALLRFRSRVEQFHAVVSVRAALDTEPSPGRAARVLRQREALRALARRGEALAHWHRLTRWLERVERAVGADKHAAAAVRRLRKRAVHRCTKAADRYRLWLSQPACRRHRNTVVRALARTPSWALEPGVGATAFAQFVASVSTVDHDDWDAVDAAWRASAGWLAVGAPLDAVKRVALVRVHRGLQRQRIARRLAERLHALAEREPALADTVERIQPLLAGRTTDVRGVTLDATLMLQLPLRARFVPGPAVGLAA
ncbi:MAG: hypothetical protein AAGA11_10840 [Pseudomonadota bacterium]